MKKYLVILACLLVASPSFAQLKMAFGAADTNPAFTLVNGGSQAISMIVTTNGAGNNMKVIIGTVTNTIDGSGTTDTIAELAAAIEACTNSSGTAVITVDTSMSLNTDSTDGELLDGTYTVAASKGSRGSVLWDTSTAKFYSVAVDGGVLKYMFGTISGTGDYVARVYANGVLAYQSPATTNTAILDEDFGGVGLPVGGKVIVRATCTTTATTGNIGAVVQANK